MTLDQMNTAEAANLLTALLDCCASHVWADEMVLRRPYRDSAELERTAAQIWNAIDTRDWLAAFAGHPKIGEKNGSAKWSAKEQSGMSSASEETTESISRLNEEYERKFGWIFIVCASGKSAEEMLQILQTRLQNDFQTELMLAAAEQLKITHLRLRKLVAE